MKKKNEIERVQNSVQKILENCRLTPIEILGVLEIAKQEVHDYVNYVVEDKQKKEKKTK